MTDREMIKDLVYCGSKYHDKPHQLWNSLRLAAISVGDTEAADRFNEYYLSGDPSQQKIKSLRKSYGKLAGSFIINLLDDIDEGREDFEDYRVQLERLMELINARH